MGILDLTNAELRQIDPQNIESVLSQFGWRAQGGVPQISRQWVYSDSISPLSIAVPLNPNFDDYTLRVREIIQKLIRVLPLDPESILYEIAIPGVDEITSTKHENTVRGSINWKAAESQIVGFREQLVASAKATEKKERHFGRSHRKIAQDFFGQLRMGQTRVGSFVITALSPVGPLPTTDNRGIKYGDHMGTTGRQVVQTLESGLTNLLEASNEWMVKKSAPVFDETVAEGVSIDLINAVKRNLGTSEAAETTITWNPRTPRPDSTPSRRVTFESRHVAALETAVARLKSVSASTGVDIVGMVTLLEREEPGRPGVIHIRVIDGSDASVVRVELRGEYDKAVDYHKSGYLIRVRGAQNVEGSQYWIRQPQSLELIDPRANETRLPDAPRNPGGESPPF